jgi:AcrR family transcriptional regulator
MTEKSTKERILDEAEHLFALKGYHNTSLREITGKAVANLAAVNYHFGSKENLLDAVIKRRLNHLDRQRLGQLEDITAVAQKDKRLPRVDDILRAFIEPTIRSLTPEAESRDFITIISRAHTDPDGTIRHLFLQKLRPTFEAFLRALSEALPQLPVNTVHCRFLFAIGAMAHTIMRAGHSEFFTHLPVDDAQNVDVLSLTEELIAFASRGMGGA